MTNFLLQFAHNTWELTAQMAPYLWFGFAVAGALHVLIRKDAVKKWLGKPGIGGVVKASILGVPMPLCSCSVIPVAASLRKSGATRGATASFLSSTPQTGVDSILATYGLLGGMFTAVRVIVAFTCGILTGYLIEVFCADKAPAKAATPEGLTFQPARSLAPWSPQMQTASAMHSDPTSSCCTSKPTQKTGKLGEALRYGLYTLPTDLGKALIFGLLLAGMITTLLPEDLLSGQMSTGISAFLLATLISLPLYVCATASIPMAYAFMTAGLSPGAALVFLITGPATNTATVVTVWKQLGRKATVIYLACLLIVSWLAGWLFNQAFANETSAVDAHPHHQHLHLTWWEHSSAALLVALLAIAVWKSQVSAKSNQDGKH